MVCKHKDCFNCPEKDCVLDNKELEDITEVVERKKRKSYNRTYYLKHQDELKERARLRARKNKEEQSYRVCKHCGKKIDLKSSYRRIEYLDLRFIMFQSSYFVYFFPPTSSKYFFKALCKSTVIVPCFGL